MNCASSSPWMLGSRSNEFEFPTIIELDRGSDNGTGENDKIISLLDEDENEEDHDERSSKSQNNFAAVATTTEQQRRKHQDDEVEFLRVPPCENKRLKIDDDDEVEIVGFSPGKNKGSDKKQNPKRSHYFRCAICLEEEIEAFKGYTLELCRHRFCTICLQRLIESKSQNNAIAATAAVAAVATTDTSTENMSIVSCPEVGCNTNLTNNDIRYVYRYNPKDWSSYTEAVSVAFVEQQVIQGSARRCPSKNCNFTFLYEKREYGCSFQCPQCKSSYCLDCAANNGQVGPIHEGVSCCERVIQIEQQIEERKKLEEWRIENSQADERFQKLMEKESVNGCTKRCPKCKAFITKNGGCNHMRCRCGHNYNWSAA